MSPSPSLMAMEEDGQVSQPTTAGRPTTAGQYYASLPPRVPSGWLCPRCGCGVAPYVTVCPCMSRPIQPLPPIERDRWSLPKYEPIWLVDPASLPQYTGDDPTRHMPEVVCAGGCAPPVSALGYTMTDGDGNVIDRDIVPGLSYGGTA